MSGGTRSERTEALRRFRSYPEYRNAGVEWLGEIPAHWAVMRIKDSATKIGSGKTPSGGAEVYVTEGVMLLRSQNIHFGGLRLDDVAYIDYETDADMSGSRVREGDVLLNITGASLGRCCVAHLHGSAANVNQHVCVIRPRASAFDTTFLAAVLASRAGQAQIFTTENGISRDALNFQQIGRIVVSAPPLLEQRLIAAFLDRETARIDALVAKKERLIELLQEQRTALITRAVTKGLDPNVPMKDSGVEWLGEIPAHWEVKRLKNVVPAITVGIVVTPAKYYVCEGVPCLRSLNITRGHVDMGHMVFISAAANELHRKSKIYEGDVLVVRTGRAGTAVVVPRQLDGANCIDLLIVRRSSALDSRFLYYFINSTATSGQVEVSSVGAIQEHYNTGTLAQLLVTAMPRNEQCMIAAFLDRETVRIDAMVAKIRDAIDRLKELRTALISAAVTGKIDVREQTA